MELLLIQISNGKDPQRPIGTSLGSKLWIAVVVQQNRVFVEVDVGVVSAGKVARDLTDELPDGDVTIHFRWLKQSDCGKVISKKRLGMLPSFTFILEDRDRHPIPFVSLAVKPDSR